MPIITENLEQWNQEYDWSQQGEEWSHGWGGSESQWFTAILPRIHTFVPTDTILEIAPGFGRWTQYLKAHCQHLIVVDLAEQCIEACKQRFAHDSHITYHVNDGKSLDMIPDGSIDFLFSFDSLVHAESDVIEAYVNQFAKKLKPNGIGFVHHSNTGNYAQLLSLVRTIPANLRYALIQGNFLINSCWHAESMTAELFATYCDRAGLQCTSQEMISWCHRRYLIGCLSVFTLKGSTWDRPNQIFKNPGFVYETKRSVELSRHYASSSFRSDANR